MAILEPTGAPPWWSRVAKSIGEEIRKRPGAPSLLCELPGPDLAGLPDPAKYRNALFVSTDLGPLISDGSNWFPITLGAAIT